MNESRQVNALRGWSRLGEEGEIGKTFREKRFRSGLDRQRTGVVCLFSLGLRV